MRIAAVRFEGFLLGLAEFQRLPAIDRRQPARQTQFAPELQLLRRLIAGIKQARRLQPLGCRGIVRNEQTGARSRQVGCPASADPAESCVGIFRRERTISVSSKRSMKWPSFFSANSQLNKAVRALPIWM